MAITEIAREIKRHRLKREYDDDDRCFDGEDGGGDDFLMGRGAMMNGLMDGLLL